MTAQQLVLTATSELDRRAAAWLDDNPHVYDAIVRLARQVKADGHDRAGIGHLWEVCRWELRLSSGEEPALNNSYRAYVAREVMRLNPDLDGFFETRVRKAGAS